jgi:hypothetical protein
MKIVLPDINLPKIDWPELEIDWARLAEDAPAYGIAMILLGLAILCMWMGFRKPLPIESIRGRQG